MTARHGASPGHFSRTTERLWKCRSRVPLRRRNTQIQPIANPSLPSAVTKASRAMVKHSVRRSEIFNQSGQVRLTVSTEHLSIPIMPASLQPTAFRRHSAVQRPGLPPTLGTVDGDIYVGQTVAGGFGTGVTLPSGAHLTFDRPCGFLVQIHNRVATAIETDRNVILTFEWENPGAPGSRAQPPRPIRRLGP